MTDTTTSTWNWQKLILFLVVFLAYSVALFLVARSTKQPEPPKEKTKIEWKHDTTYVLKSKIEYRDTSYATATKGKDSISSSTSGTKSGTSYSAKVTIYDLQKDLEKYPANWEVDFIPPPERIIKDTLIVDNSKETIVTKYLKPPFFLNEWFYVSTFVSVIATLIIIFQ